MTYLLLSTYTVYSAGICNYKLLNKSHSKLHINNYIGFGVYVCLSNSFRMLVIRYVPAQLINLVTLNLF